jgi:hypothetical protein
MTSRNTTALQALTTVPTPTQAGGLGEPSLSKRFAWQRLSLVGLLFLAACSSPRMPTPSPPPAPLPSAPQAPAAATQPVPSPSLPQAPAPSARPLPPVHGISYRNWDEFRLHAGRRLVQANPQGTFTGAVPEPLLAIPVLEVELNADGSVRRIVVQRQPSQARDTVQLAIDAVQRAAPFGDVSHLPRPWKFSEVFLFRDDRRFKPRVLDL